MRLNGEAMQSLTVDSRSWLWTPFLPRNRPRGRPHWKMTTTF
jgi:hypothetical protein